MIVNKCNKKFSKDKKENNNKQKIFVLIVMIRLDQLIININALKILRNSKKNNKFSKCVCNVMKKSHLIFIKRLVFNGINVNIVNKLKVHKFIK